MVKWELVEKVSRVVSEDTWKLERLELWLVEAYVVELVEMVRARPKLAERTVALVSKHVPSHKVPAGTVAVLTVAVLVRSEVVAWFVRTRKSLTLPRLVGWSCRLREGADERERSASARVLTLFSHQMAQVRKL